jgi:D-glycerate 3-kinase
MSALAVTLLPWCHRRLVGSPRRPWILGLQGPQGCGKSTAAAALVESAKAAGWRALAVSIDDFYLTYEEQRRVAERHPGNPYLLYRGYPGTHDVALGARVIDALATAEPGAEVRVPSYDKSAHAGRGDRAPLSSWKPAIGPLDFLIVEGWMLGFAPVEEGGLEPDLIAPNRYLAAYAAWTKRLHALIHLTVESMETIVEWRVGSERARRERGETALSDADARDYIERFLPAYRTYVPALDAKRPLSDSLTLVLGPNREPITRPSTEPAR